jgi:hypothetical protein
MTGIIAMPNQGVTTMIVARDVITVKLQRAKLSNFVRKRDALLISAASNVALHHLPSENKEIQTVAQL